MISPIRNISEVSHILRLKFELGASPAWRPRVSVLKLAILVRMFSARENYKYTPMDMALVTDWALIVNRKGRKHYYVVSEMEDYLSWWID